MHFSYRSRALHVAKCFAGWSSALLILGTQINCGPSDPDPPESSVNCGSAAYVSWKLNGGTEPPVQPQGERIGQQRMAIVDEGNNTDYQIDARTWREVVQIRLYQGNDWILYGTGTVVGRHTILTVAHNFFDEDYDRAVVAIRRQDGTWAETPIIRTATHPNYNDLNAGGAASRYDLALVEVAPDLTRELALTPFEIGTNYTPQRDCNQCPTDLLTLNGYAPRDGQPPLAGLDTVPLRGVQATPLNSSRNIAQTHLLSFVPYTRPGDSGGPVFWFDPSINRHRVVAVLVGDNTANDSFAPGPGSRVVTVAATIREDSLQALRNILADWERNNRRVSVQFPAAEYTYPNGTQNPASNNYPENGPAGHANPVSSSHEYGNGYFIDFPFSKDPKKWPDDPGGGSSCK